MRSVWLPKSPWNTALDDVAYGVILVVLGALALGTVVGAVVGVPLAHVLALLLR